MAVSPLQHSVLVLVEVHYKRGIPEKYEMVMAPVGDGTLVCVGMHSPYAGDNRERMHVWPTEQYDSEALCAVHVLSACVFGDGRATPRIIGAPDWVEVTLEVLTLGGRKPRRLLQLELTAESSVQGSCLHWDTTAVVGHEAVSLCPEDADPLYAITRLAMADWVSIVVPQQALSLPLVPAPAVAVREDDEAEAAALPETAALAHDWPAGRSLLLVEH